MKTNTNNIVVTGYGECGKDTFCTFLEQSFGLSWVSSSRYAFDEFLFAKMVNEPLFAHITKMWQNPSDALRAALYEARREKQGYRDWYAEQIIAYNTPDPSRLGRGIFANYDIYNGIRNANELNALKQIGLVDLVIWIDRPLVPIEPVSSMTVHPSDATIIVNNNGTLVDLYEKAYQIGKIITNAH